MPILGLGTWALSGKQAVQAVSWALEAGYRMIDTASMYGNEQEIGEALKKSSISRDKIFITTKVWPSEQGFENTVKAFERSLKNLNLKYIDLYLIHWPAGDLSKDTWRAFEKLLNEGKVKAIGVSNYTIQQLKDLLKNSSTAPCVNQVEFSPFLYQYELMEFCQSRKIALEAYCPLTRARKLDHPTIHAIGEKHSKSAAQALIRWGLQHDVIQIPKSGNKNHILENSNVFDFELDQDDMKILDKLNEDFRVVSL